MCMHPLNVKSVSPFGPSRLFLPCGSCAECRNQNRSAWAFRLMAECQFVKSQPQPWRIGFFTLTYNEDHLPRIPKTCYLDYDELRDYSRSYEENPKISCFSRDDIKTFINSLRSQLWREFRVTGCKFMICCEYGEKRRRPHYHGLIMFPAVVSSERMHQIIADKWCTRGFLFPEKYDGSGKYDKSSFEVQDDNGLKAAAYASKYCCKDITFEMKLNNLKDLIDFKSKDLKNCRYFHTQSKSIGASIIRNLSDEDKLKIVLDGYQFIGKDKLQCVPIYIRDKILFTPYYVIDSLTGERLVRKRASEFFFSHVKEIFERKVKFYARLFDSATKKETYAQRCTLGDKTINTLCSYNQRLIERYGSVKLASFYLSSYGVAPERIYSDIPEYKQYLLRYLRFPFGGMSLQDEDYISELNNVCSFILGSLSLCGDPAKVDELQSISQYFKEIGLDALF